MLCFFFFKQKTAYDMRISDWSSDVCSSDLVRAGLEGYGDRRRTIGVAGRRHIKQALYAIQLLLDYLSDILLQRRSFRPGICRPDREEIGRASFRESVCQYVYSSVVAVSFKKKNLSTTHTQTLRHKHNIKHN